MAEYEIKRWDGVMFGNSITKMPMIYIEPDLKFIEFVQANNYAVICNISGTGMVYDEFSIPGVVDQSCSIPNCRPNFYEKNGYYVITLMGTWNGYPHPDKLGKVVFSGLKVPEEDSEVILVDEDVVEEARKRKMDKMNKMNNKSSNSSPKKSNNNLTDAINDNNVFLYGISFILLLIAAGAGPLGFAKPSDSWPLYFFIASVLTAIFTYILSE